MLEGFSKRVSTIVDKFTKSNGYHSTNANAFELHQIIFALNDTQREAILDAFCDNDQIYHAWECPNLIKSMFQEDRKQKVSCASYWLSFLEKLNNNQWTKDRISNLINMIDSYCKEVEAK
ncbi:hypothetical protein [Dolichospermum compactum]|uniref:Uncharacterized protein n=1 Tax=Dolichospermum compactum NIES-806 TaxID=1973481 RepID=A0A1Z4V7Z9_9CYAN|nr:hypothetical protein [Dolichospermum compactum]BAZ87513.1 hypothetical protein NIES806_37370 [Dolichospermum compactum NIES-806]